MRRRPLDDSSLDLLLDTICNVFGGILFLALLVVLTSRQLPTHRSRPVVEGQVTSEQVIRRELERLQIEQAGLQQKHAALVAAADLTSTGIDPAMLEAVASASERQQDLESQVVAQRQVVADLERQIEQHRQRTQRAVIASRDAKTQLASRQARQRQAEAERTSQLRMPRSRPSDKREFIVAISGGKLFFPCRYDGDGHLLGWDEGVVVAIDNTVLRLRPEGGIGIDDEAAAAEAIQPIVTKVRPRTHCIAIAVWPDAYPQFRLVRDALVKAGFEYKLVLLPDEGKLSLGEASTRVQ